jgi:hypothetical protein
MEYLSESRDYFQKFRKAHLSEYSDVMKHYNVGGDTGYQYFYRCNEVIQTIRDIYHNLEDFYHYTSIPEGFATPRALVESWVNFHNMLTSRDEVFSEIKNHIIEERKKTSFYDKEDNVYDYLPEPLVRIDAVRFEVIELLSHLLEMDDVKAFINPSKDASEIPETCSTVEINRNRLNEYSRDYHFYINEGAIMAQYINHGSVGAMGENARSDNNTFTQLERKTLSEAAAEIQQLLNQLSKTEYTSEADLVDALHQEIRRNPTLKARLVNALKSGGLEALKAIFNHPVFSIPAETVKGWLEAE